MAAKLSDVRISCTDRLGVHLSTLGFWKVKGAQLTNSQQKASDDRLVCPPECFIFVRFVNGCYEQFRRNSVIEKPESITTGIMCRDPTCLSYMQQRERHDRPGTFSQLVLTRGGKWSCGTIPFCLHTSSNIYRSTLNTNGTEG